MSARQMIHNPGFLSDDDLVRSFVVREVELDMLLETVRENTGSANQHLLVISPRGMGKTTLVRRLAIAVKRDPDLSKRFYPILFAEESYDVMGVGEFWLEAVRNLGVQTGQERWRKVWEGLSREKDATRLGEMALGRLLDFADETGQRLLLVVENLDLLFNEQMTDDDAWMLRRTLQNEPRLMLLCTATSRFGQIEKSDKAFFDLFAIRDLRPLPDADCARLWQARTQQEVDAHRIRPLAILTGGNPRLLTLVSGFARGRTFQQVFADLEHLIDENTTYFKANLEILPALERKVFVGLADLWAPSLAREVASRVRLDVNTASAMLKRLVERGVVTEKNRSKRNTRYQVAERLYNIYHLMRCRGAAADRVRALVEFMTGFYTEDELKDRAQGLLDEATGLPEGGRCHHLAAFEGIFYAVKSRELRDEMIEKALEHLPRFREELPERIRHEEEIAVALGEVPEPKGRKAKDPDRWCAYGESLENMQPPDLTRAEVAYRKAIALNGEHTLSLLRLVLLLRKMGRWAETVEHLNRLIEVRPDWGSVHSSLGHTLAAMGAAPAAEHAFREAIAAGVPDPEANYRLSKLLLDDLARPAEALTVCDEYLRVFPTEGKGLSLRARILRYGLDRPEEAAHAYRRAAEIDIGNASLVDLGGLLFELGRLEEAEAVYLRAAEIDPDDPQPILLRAIVLSQGPHDRSSEAESIVRAVLDRWPEEAVAWGVLAQILMKKDDRLVEARSALERVQSIAPNSLLTLAFHGSCLVISDEGPQGAEQVLRRTISTIPRFYPTWKALIELLARQATDEALMETIHAAAVQFRGNPKALDDLACFLLKHGDLSRLPLAELLVRQALDLAPTSGPATHTLATILGRQGRWPEAMVLAPVFLNDDRMRRAIDDVTAFSIEAAAAGQSRPLIEALVGSRLEALLEPLVAALRMDLGEETIVPEEIRLVAEDVLAKIGSRRVREETGPAFK